MTSTPDTTTTFGPTGNNADAGAMAVYVFRGVDSGTPLDVAAVTATGTATGRPNGASITPSTSGAIVVVAGGASAGTGATFTTSDLSAFRTATSADTQDAMIGVGNYVWSSGAFDPAAWTGGTTNAADSWAAITLALRPAAENGTISVSYSAGATSIDLTAQSFTDYWHPRTVGGAITKSGGGSTIGVTSPGSALAAPGSFTSSWSDGSPTASGSDSGTQYLTAANDSAGIAITVPASTAARRLKIYLGNYGGSSSGNTLQLTATLNGKAVTQNINTMVATGFETGTITVDFTDIASGNNLGISLRNSARPSGDADIEVYAIGWAPNSTTYNQSASATTSPVASLSTVHIFAVALSIAASAIASRALAIGKVISRTESPLASMVRQTNKIAGATSSAAAALSKSIANAAQAASSATASIAAAKTPCRPVAGSTAPGARFCAKHQGLRPPYRPQPRRSSDRSRKRIASIVRFANRINSPRGRKGHAAACFALGDAHPIDREGGASIKPPIGSTLREVAKAMQAACSPWRRSSDRSRRRCKHRLANRINSPRGRKGHAGGVLALGDAHPID